jgi:hypothetical protein
MEYYRYFSTIGALFAQTVGSPPFPASDAPPGSTVTGVGGLGAEAAVTASRESARFALQGAEHLWQEWVSPNSPIFSAIIKGTFPLLLLGFIFWATFWAREVMSATSRGQGIPWLSFQKVLWPVIIIIFLQNNGALLAYSEIAAKSVIYNISNGILDITVEGITAKDWIRQRLFRDTQDAATAQALRQCQGFRDNEPIYNQCIQNAQSQAQQLAQQAGLGGLGGNNPNFFSNPLALFNWLGNQIRVAVMSLIITSVMSAIASIFHWFIGIVLAIWASTGPFWLMITLLPIDTKGIYAFVSGFFGLGMIMIVYNLLQAGTAVSLAQSDVNDPLLVPFVMGFLNPIIATFIGSGSAVGMFLGLSSLVKTGLEKVVGLFLPII